MTGWHPIDTLHPVEMIFPKPGTDQPFAIIRWVEIQRDGVDVWTWRAVTHKEPWKLIAYNPGSARVVHAGEPERYLGGYPTRVG